MVDRPSSGDNDREEERRARELSDLYNMLEYGSHGYDGHTDVMISDKGLIRRRD